MRLRNGQGFEWNYQECPKPKRARVKTAIDFDPLKNLLPEIMLDIFLYLRNEDLFLSCSLVSKSWHSFLNRESFWKELIVREFGSERARSFLRIDGALQRLKDLLHSNTAFRYHFCRELESEQTIEVPVLNDMSLSDFAASVRSQIRCNSDGYDDDEPLLFTAGIRQWAQAWVLKMSSPLCEVVDTLKLPVMCGSFKSPAKILFLDSNLDTLSAVTEESDNDYFFVENYPAGVRYIAALHIDFTSLHIGIAGFRFTFPSLAKILTLLRPLMSPYSTPSSDEVEQIFNTDPGLLNYGRIRNEETEHTPFGRAIFWDKNEVWKQYFKRGAVLSPGALAYAAKFGCIGAVKCFFERGVQVNENVEGLPLLGHALSLSGEHRAKMASYLIAQGADVNYALEDGTTLLMHFVKNGNKRAVNFMLKNGAKCNLLNKAKQSALRLAMNRKLTLKTRAEAAVSILQYLLEAGANVNEKFVAEDGAESTALIEAVRIGNVEAVGLLIGHGADIDAKDSTGWSAMDFAQLNGTKNAKSILPMLLSVKNKKL